MKADIYAELYLWNKNLDASLRVLQRMETLGICPSQLLKVHQTRLEQLRTALNLDVLRPILTQERIDDLRMNWPRQTREEVDSSGLAPQ